MTRLADKVVLVTGAGSGIGAEIARAAWAEGATVWATDRNRDAVDTAAQQFGSRFVPYQLDVASESDWMQAMTAVSAAHGRLDVLVNNAGILVVGNIEETTLDQYRLANAVMNEGVFLGCREAMPWLARSGNGAIVNIASTAAIRGYSGLLAYSAAKGAVRALSRTLAVTCQELGQPVRCNCIFPSDIETPMQQAFDRREAREVAAGLLGPRLPGAPADIAAAVIYLASDESRYVTGTELVVDNSTTARTAW